METPEIIYHQITDPKNIDQQIKNLFYTDEPNPYLTIDLNTPYYAIRSFDRTYLSPDMFAVEYLLNKEIHAGNIYPGSTTATLLDYHENYHKELKKFIVSGKPIIIIDRGWEMKESMMKSLTNLITVIQRECKVKHSVDGTELRYNPIQWFKYDETN